MLSDRELFTLNYKEIKDKVTVADGKEVIVSGIGSGVIKLKGNKRTVTLKDVLHVPKLSGNLISVKRITENGFKVQFQGMQHTKECIHTLHNKLDHRCINAIK